MNSTLSLIVVYSFKSLFTFGKPTPVRTVLNILILIFVLLHGWSFSYLVTLAEESEKMGQIFLRLMPYLYGILFFWNLLRGIFPVYTKYNTIFPKAYPLSIFQKNTYELLMNVISIPSFSVLMFFLPAILKSSKYSLEFLGMSLFIILVSNILNIALKRIIHFRIRPNSTALKSINAEVLSSNRLLFNLFWRKSIIVMSLMIGYIFKIVLLFIFFVGINNNKPQMIENMSMAFFLFSSPLIIFTYAFNNIFGLLPQPISWFSRQENLLSKLFTSYLFLIATPLIFDIIITFVFLFAMNKLDTDFTLNYFLVTILLIINGFLGSIWRPLFIKVFFANFKSNTDMLVTFFSIITFGCVFLLKGVYQISALAGLCIAFLFYFNFIKKTIHKRVLAFNNPT